MSNLGSGSASFNNYISEVWQPTNNIVWMTVSGEKNLYQQWISNIGRVKWFKIVEIPYPNLEYDITP